MPLRHIPERWLTRSLQGLLVLGALLAAIEGNALGFAATVAVVAITFLPSILGTRLEVRIPPQFEALAVLFIYASLFLGEVHGYYVRFWWWDALLHLGSGALLGIVGFLLVYVLNEKREIGLDMKPAFVALFAFMFAMGMGALWEIFEFAMDELFGLNMQKSGLQDTMWDLIVDAVGAMGIAIYGWVHLWGVNRGSFIDRWVGRFVRANPRLFRSERGTRD